MRIVLRYLGLFLLGIVTFVFALQATFPYDRVKSKLEEIASAKVDMSIGKIERGIFPGRFYLKDVTIRTRPNKEELEKLATVTDQKERDKQMAQFVTTIYIEKIQVDLGIFAGIRGIGSVDFNAKFEKGSISGNVIASKDEFSLHVVGDDVPSEDLPMREVLSNLPMSGNVTFALDLDVPIEKLKTGKTGPNWLTASGGAEFSCPASCTIGDGKAKLKLKAKNSRSQAFAAEGTDFGHVNIETLVAKVEVKDGKVDITKFETKSPDVELHVEYTMTLQQDLNESVVLGCLRFKGTDALKKREPKTYDQILLTGAARAPDGLDNIRLKGTFKDMKKLPEICGPGVSAMNADQPGSGAAMRPNLTVQPDEPTKPVATTSPQFNPSPTMFDAGVVGDAPGVINTKATIEMHDGGVPSVGSGSAGSGSQTGTEPPPGAGTAGAAAPGEPAHKH